MTSQPESVRGEATQHLRPLRELAVFVLLASSAVMSFVAVLNLIPSGSGDEFGTRAVASFNGLINLPTIGFPLLAVLLATVVKPVHPKATLIVTLALVQYALAAFFSLIFGVLIAFIYLVEYSFRSALEQMLLRAAWLAVFAVAGYAVFQIWYNMCYSPRPRQRSGLYGHSQPGHSQPGHSQSGHSQPGHSQSGQPYPGQHVATPTSGHPAPAPGYVPPPAAYPVPPAYSPPAAYPVPPAYSPPAAYPSAVPPAGPVDSTQVVSGPVDSTQVVSGHEAGPEQTQMINSDWLSYGDDHPPRHR